MNEPTIQTERLLLMSFTHDDAADVFAYASNPNVSRFTTWLPHKTIADSAAFINMVLRRSANQHTWAIRLRSEPAVVGTIEFGLKDESNAEFHFVLAESLWNRGLMTEAASAVVEWGLANYPAVIRISTRAMSQNIGSHRVMEKCGLQFEKIRVDRFAKFPEPVEQRQYALIRARLPTAE
jgi:[ribosomal protein S5]-alanine N-acetyltransferase